MDSPPNKPKNPKLVVDKNYINYTKVQRLKDKLSGQPTSAYEAYDPNGQKGTHIEYGTLVPGQRYKQYPDTTELAQNDPELGPLLGLLPKDAEGRLKVYGEHEGMPLEGPVDWKKLYKRWSDVGPQLHYRPTNFDTGPLHEAEIDFCRRYGIEFKKKLGSGGFGEVWCADWHQKDIKGKPFSSTYAVKVINIKTFLANKSTLRESVSFMLKEAKITKNLIHNNILRVENIFHIHDQETGFPMVRVLMFMTMCDGDVTYLLYQKSRLPWNAKFNEDEARLVMWDLCQGLKYLHDQNIVHLDIKPANILFKGNLLTGHGIYMLGDFGLSKAFSSDDTKTEGIGGTDKYLPPEVDQPGESDAKFVDIFELGSTLAEILVSPWYMEMFRRELWSPDGNDPILNYTPDTITMEGLQSRWGLSFHAIDLIRKMTALEPERRPTIDQVIADDWVNQMGPIPADDCSLS